MKTDTKIKIAHDNAVEEYLQENEKGHPVCDFEIKIGGSWITGDTGYLQDPVGKFMWNISEILIDLYEGKESGRHTFLDRAWLVFKRDGEHVTVERRLAKEDIGVEVSGETELDTLASAVLEESRNVLAQFDEYDHAPVTEIAFLRESTERLAEYAEE